MKKTTGFKRVMNATGYSIQGLKAAWQNEAAFRQESILLVLAIILASIFDISTVQRILLIGSVVLVMIVELINSAIEALVDRIGPEQHPLSGRAKDIGSAAVFVTLCLAGFVWLLIIYNRYL